MTSSTLAASTSSSRTHGERWRAGGGGVWVMPLYGVGECASCQGPCQVGCAFGDMQEGGVAGSNFPLRTTSLTPLGKLALDLSPDSAPPCLILSPALFCLSLLCTRVRVLVTHSFATSHMLNPPSA
jgi:hypothetical protein